MSTFANKLQNQTVLIFGGTGGIGLATASVLLSSGANVILTSSRQAKLDSTLDGLRSQHPTAAPHAIAGFTCDLATPDVETNLTALHASVKEHLGHATQTGHLDHLIYAAGDALPTAPLASITQATFVAALQVRALSCLLAVKHFHPLLLASHTSTVTLTGGSISEKPTAGGWGMVAFAAAGLNGLARQLAADLAPVRVNAVAPGVVATDLWAGMSDADRAAFYAGVEEALPTGRVPGPDDVAESYLYLLRDRNVTGTVIHTNGGAFL